MNQEIEIRAIEQAVDIAACYEVMAQLRPHLKDVDGFVQQVMRQRDRGYRLSAAWNNDRVMGAIGYRLQENLLYGNFVFVDDLVVHQDVRSHGIGAQLLATARGYAREQGCRQFVLDTGLHMPHAQRFYFRQGLLARAMGFTEAL
jgi:GNAT superfamily N-acetyltransferase